MRTITIVILCLIVGFAAAWMVLGQPASESTHGHDETATSSTQLWTCGMHPEIISEEPGVCPICNMNLTPKKEAGAAASGVTIDPVTRQNMGLVTVRADYQTIERHVRAFGNIAYREPNRHSVNLKVGGWVERLFVNEVGEQVFEGQPLLELYAPDLVAAQREYLVASESHDVAALTDLSGAAADRLRNWDISQDQIDRLTSNEDIIRTMTIRAPAHGFIVSKMVNEGDHLAAGKSLYEIVDLSTVWVIAHVYEQDVPFVSIGQQALVSFPKSPGETYLGRVEYVAPFLGNERQIEVRITLDNEHLKLKPGMYAEVSLHQELPEQHLVIPRRAVINSGVREIVYIATSDDTYQARQVTTGVVGSGDLVQVTSGLTAGEQVVVSGQFLLDSESRLGEAIGGHAHGSHGTEEDNQGEHSQSHAQTDAADPYDIHTCPMPQHFHVLNYGPGACPDCGMDLVPATETENTDIYVCPMPSCGVAESEPGTCPVCNMNLIKYEPESDHDH